MERMTTDILILGSGGAGLMAALRARRANPDLDITIAVKGLLGKTGCTRMVQGGYNVAVAEGDSLERHFMDTIEGGKWLNHQELAWRLVTGAREVIAELENRFGCFFDRNPDGTLHQKAFAGQTFDRTVHKGDLTGIEIINRLSEHVFGSGIRRLEDHRAVSLIRTRDGLGVAGAVMIDMRTGQFRFVGAKAVLMATGGGPTMYRYHTPSGDKSCDGMAMMMRLGLPFRDMEMVQFHPTGLVAGPETRLTGTIIEEGLRGFGGHLLNGNGERFMENYDPRGERATRDIVSRAMYEEMRAGRTGPNGGLFITMAHLDSREVRKRFKGMVERCADLGMDLVSGQVEVVPTAHYMMGGVAFGIDGSTGIPGLYAAGEDTGGVHGANRLGGNGVANSTVFGAIAGQTMAGFAGGKGAVPDPDSAQIEWAEQDCRRPLGRRRGSLAEIRDGLQEVMWEEVGIIRTASGLNRAVGVINGLNSVLDVAGVDSRSLAYNMDWHEWINLRNTLLVSQVIATAAATRRDSRGAHFREDFPETGDLKTSANTWIQLSNQGMRVSMRPVEFTRIKPGESLIPPDEG